TVIVSFAIAQPVPVTGITERGYKNQGRQYCRCIHLRFWNIEGAAPQGGIGRPAIKVQWRVPLFNDRQTDVVAERMQIMQQRNHVGFIPYGPETGDGTDG